MCKHSKTRHHPAFAGLASQRRLKEKKQLHPHQNIALSYVVPNPNEVDSILAEEQPSGAIGPDPDDENQAFEVVPNSSTNAVDDSIRLEQTGCDNGSTVIEKKAVRLEGKFFERPFNKN